MTLVVTAHGKRSVWVLADRRLSVGKRGVSDSARKIAFVSTTDAEAIIAYAGLGRTAGNTEPSDWIANVVRNRTGVPIEMVIRELAGAALRVFPAVLAQLPASERGHAFVAAVLFKNGSTACYTATVSLEPGHREPTLRLHRQYGAKPEGQTARPPRLVITGSGQSALRQDKTWQRPILRLIAAHERGRLAPELVAPAFAALNLRVSNEVVSVGPQCLVGWRTAVPGSGNAHIAFAGTTRDLSTPSLPTIANGMDIGMLVRILHPKTFASFEEAQAAINEPVDMDAINAEIRRLHTGPHEKLK